MKEKLISFIFLSLFFCAICLAQQIKPPNVSGTFYPESAKILAETVKQFLDWAQPKQKDRDILALIVPHAGYEYSGGVAAYGFKAVKGKPIRSVIIIAPSHFVPFRGISVYPQGAWQTPLGNVPVDAEIASALIAQDPRISFYEPAFSREHSVEVEVPFLQIVLDDFKIVPIVVGEFSDVNCRILSQALLAVIKDRKDVLVVASTDMSHYHPYEQACRMDSLTMEELKKFQPESLSVKLLSGECELCGAAAVISTLLYAQGRDAREIEILKYANSGDVSGEKGRVVGYFSALIYAAPAQEATAEAAVQPGRDEMLKETKDVLTEAQKKRLLAIARQTIEAYVTAGRRLDFTENDPALLRPMGAFVTIHKQDRLRGCIGNIIAQGPLYLTVRDMAIEAATGDPRFPAVTPAELKDIDIEISVLSVPQEVNDINEIKLGVHGVIVKRGFASGVFLPQVAEETGWTKEEFLSNLCAHKAGLEPLAWKDKRTQMFSFTAQVFGEKDIP